MTTHSFNEIAKQISREKERDFWWNCHVRDIRGEDIYTDFCVYTHIYEWKRDNPKHFAEYLKKFNKTLTTYQRKFLAEKYFGYKFDEDKQVWTKCDN